MKENNGIEKELGEQMFHDLFEKEMSWSADGQMENLELMESRINPVWIDIPLKTYVGLTIRTTKDVVFYPTLRARISWVHLYEKSVFLDISTDKIFYSLYIRHMEE